MTGLCDTEEGATEAIKSKSADLLLGLLGSTSTEHPHNALMVRGPIECLIFHMLMLHRSLLWPNSSGSL